MCCDATKAATDYLRRTWGKGTRTFRKSFRLTVCNSKVILSGPCYPLGPNGKITGPGWKKSDRKGKSVDWCYGGLGAAVNEGMHMYRERDPGQTTYKVKGGQDVWDLYGKNEFVELPVQVRKQDFVAAEPAKGADSEIVATQYHLRKSVWDSVVAVLTGDRA